MLRSPRTQVVSAPAVDYPQQSMEDLTTHTFLCQVEGCGRQLIGIFRFATHEKYFHKLPASQRASQCFMHSCPIPPCTMEYVRREDLQTHIANSHQAAGPSTPIAVLDAHTTRSSGMMTGSPNCKNASPTMSRSISSNLSIAPPSTSSPPPSASIATISYSEDLIQAEFRQPGKKELNAGNMPGQLKARPGFDKKPENIRRKGRVQGQNSSIPCPHIHCTLDFLNQALLDKHIAKRHKRGIQFHVVPGVAALQPPFATYDQKPQAPSTEESSASASDQGPSQQARLPPLQCPFPSCGKSFPKRSNLDRHLSRTHLMSMAQSPASAASILPKESEVTPPFKTASRPPETTHQVQLKDVDGQSIQAAGGDSNFRRGQVLSPLNYPVYGCTRNFQDFKGLLVHGRDVHSLLNTNPLDRLGVFTLPYSQPTGAPMPTGDLSRRQPSFMTVPQMHMPQPVAPNNRFTFGSFVQDQQSMPPSGVMRCSVDGCNSIFTRALDFRYHEKNVHKQPASAQSARMYKLPCHGCKKSYWTREKLDEHVLEKHPATQFEQFSRAPGDQVPATAPPMAPQLSGGSQGKFRCNLCHLDFPTAKNLNYHEMKSSYHRSVLAAKRPLPV